MKREREIGIDIFRIFSMYLVMMLHFILAGGILGELEPLTLKYFVSQIIFCISFCCVNCFGLMSGYVGVNSKYKYTNIVLIWLCTSWYSGIGNLFCRCVLRSDLSRDDIIRGFFPITNQSYWYVTQYFLLFLIMPILNYALRKMKQKAMINVLIVGFLVACVYQTVLRNENLVGGYTVLWLVYLYLLGGYIKVYNVADHFKDKALIGFLITTAITFGSRVIIVFVTKTFMGKMHDGILFIRYTSPTILGEAVFLLFLFSGIKITDNYSKLKKFIIAASGLSFSAYLIQTHPVFFNDYWVEGFSEFANYSAFIILISSLIIPFVVLVGCIMLDSIREYLFKKLEIRNRLEKLEFRYIYDMFAD